MFNVPKSKENALDLHSFCDVYDSINCQLKLMRFIEGKYAFQLSLVQKKKLKLVQGTKENYLRLPLHTHRSMTVPARSSTNTLSSTHRDDLLRVTQRLETALLTHHAVTEAIAVMQPLVSLQRQSLEAHQHVVAVYGPILKDLANRRRLARSSVDIREVETDHLSRETCSATAAATSFLDVMNERFDKIEQRLRQHRVSLDKVCRNAAGTAVIVRSCRSWTSLDSSPSVSSASTETSVTKEEPTRTVLSRHIQSVCEQLLDNERAAESAAEAVVRSNTLFCAEREELNGFLCGSIISFAETKMPMYQRQKARLREELKIRALRLLEGPDTCLSHIY